MGLFTVHACETMGLFTVHACKTLGLLTVHACEALTVHCACMRDLAPEFPSLLTTPLSFKKLALNSTADCLPSRMVLCIHQQFCIS